MLRLPQASFARFEQLATVLLPMLRTHDKRLEELVADPPPKFGHATKRVEAAGEDAGLKEMQQFAHEAALAARVREFDIVRYMHLSVPNPMPRSASDGHGLPMIATDGH
jgi:hypothetical protein